MVLTLGNVLKVGRNNNIGNIVGNCIRRCLHRYQNFLRLFKFADFIDILSCFENSCRIGLFPSFFLFSWGLNFANPN